MHRLNLASVPLIGLLLASPCLAGGDAERGKAIYQARCSACHSIEFNGVGPAHKGVFGRRIGQAPGYDYSPALTAATDLWTANNLDRWLTDPEVLTGPTYGLQPRGCPGPGQCH